MPPSETQADDIPHKQDYLSRRWKNDELHENAPGGLRRVAEPITSITLIVSMLAVMLPAAYATETTRQSSPASIGGSTTGTEPSSGITVGNENKHETNEGMSSPTGRKESAVIDGNASMDGGNQDAGNRPEASGKRDDADNENGHDAQSGKASIGANQDNANRPERDAGSIGADNADMGAIGADGETQDERAQAASSDRITDVDNDGRDDTTKRIIIPCQPSGANAYDKVNHWEWAKNDTSGYNKDMYEHWAETFGGIKSSEYCWFNFKNLTNAPENNIDNYGTVHNAVDDETTHAIGQQHGGAEIPVVFELNENEYITADVKMAMSDRNARTFQCANTDIGDYMRASAIPNAFDITGNPCISLEATNTGGGWGQTHSVMITNMKSHVLYDYRLMFADSEIMSSAERTIIGTDAAFDYDFICSAYDYRCKTNGSVYAGGVYVNADRNLIDFTGGGNHMGWGGGFNLNTNESHGAMIASTASIPRHLQVNMRKDSLSKIALGLRLPTFLQDNARLIYDGNGAQSGYIAGNNGSWDSSQSIKWNSPDYSDTPFAYKKTIDGLERRMVFMGWNTNRDDPTKGTWYCDRNANTANNADIHDDAHAAIEAASQADRTMYDAWKDGIAACRTSIALSRENDVLDGKGDGTITLYAQWLPAPVMQSMPETGSHDAPVMLAIIGMTGIAIILMRKANLNALRALLASRHGRHSPSR